MRNRFGLIALLGISFCSVQSGNSDEIADKADDEQLRAVKELIDQSVAWYDVLSEAGAKTGLRPQVVLRWRNDERVNTGAAVLAIWIDQGRPEAMASIFQSGKNICHEFSSLSRSNKLVVSDKERVVWSPGKAGVEFRDVPDGPVPADDRIARLRQMKSLIGRFEARLTPNKASGGNIEILRPLARELYRYDLKDSNDTKLRDGGVFAFVMGTDPEVILMLEAVEREGNAVWQYAFARATSYAVDARLGDQVVWSAQSVSTSSNALTQLYRPIQK